MASKSKSINLPDALVSDLVEATLEFDVEYEVERGGTAKLLVIRLTGERAEEAAASLKKTPKSSPTCSAT